MRLESAFVRSLPSILILIVASVAGAETVNCTAVTTIPYTITAPGVYCLTGDMVVPAGFSNIGVVISIAASNVVLDLNGHRIDGTALGAGTGVKGIATSVNGLKNIIIRNGTLRGLWEGINLIDDPPYTTARGHLIENIIADGSTFAGIVLSGRGSVVQNNQIVSTGGSTYFGADACAYCIYVQGPGNHVLNNDIVTATYQGACVATGITFAGGSSTDELAINNRIGDMLRGIHYNGATGKYRDNLTSSVTTPYIGGNDAGNNN
jgi:hypothetical protein